MDEEEFNRKYKQLKMLKNIQEYLKSKGRSAGAVVPINVPEELLYQTVQAQGAEMADTLVHDIFQMGLNRWSEKLYQTAFGSEEDLEDFIQLVKERNKE